MRRLILIANIILLILLSVGIIAFLFYVFRARPGEVYEGEIIYEIDSMIQFVKDAVHDTASDDFLGHDDADYERRKARKAELKMALRHCMHGDPSYKNYVKSYIRDILEKAYDLTNSNLNLLIPFDNRERLTPLDMYDILLHHFKKEHGRKAFEYMVTEYNLDRKRTDIPHEEGYRIDAIDIITIFEEVSPNLTRDDKVDILVQRIYQRYKGLGVVDELRDQDIDGVNAGTSGVPEDVIQYLELDDYLSGEFQLPKAHESAWVLYKGKMILLSFLSFGSELELKRVCQNIYTYGNSKQLNSRQAYIINDMADGSRIVVVRPPLAESWAFFVRKFDSTLNDIEELITYEGKELGIGFLKFLAKGARTVAITGDQGAGKTMMLKAIIRFFYNFLTLRIQEGTSFELGLRRAFPKRNIVTMRETESIPGEEALSVQRKMDGAINIVGEAAEDKAIAWVVKASQVASLCTWFTHHGTTPDAVVDESRNALTSLGYFQDEVEAEKYVVRVLDFNLHLRNREGFRYVDHVSQFVPLANQEDYPTEYRNKDNLLEATIAFMDTVTEYFRRKTDRKTYEVRRIIEFRDGRLVPVERPTDSAIKDMLNYMSPEDGEEFLQFLDEYWGPVANG